MTVRRTYRGILREEVVHDSGKFEVGVSFVQLNGVEREIRDDVDFGPSGVWREDCGDAQEDDVRHHLASPFRLPVGGRHHAYASTFEIAREMKGGATPEYCDILGEYSPSERRVPARASTAAL